MKNELFLELLTDTYKRTIDDNQEDFETTMWVISKLCAYLLSKKILTEEEIKIIMQLEKPRMEGVKSE